MAIWLNENSSIYNGCLIIFNVGNENYDSLHIKPQNEEELSLLISKAQADGWLTLYMWDMRGPLTPPDRFSSMEESVASILVPGGQLKFSADPATFAKEMSAVAHKVIDSKIFKFDIVANSKACWRACGLVSVGGTEKFIFPPFEIDPRRPAQA